MEQIIQQAAIRLKNVKCPDCSKGVLTKIPFSTDSRRLVFYTDTDRFALAHYVQVHKCPKCGKLIGVEYAS